MSKMYLQRTKDNGKDTYKKLNKVISGLVVLFILVSVFSLPIQAEAIAPWSAGTSYAIDDLVSYDGNNYRCIQSHTALAGWEPANVPALWAFHSVGEPVIETVAAPVFSPRGGTYAVVPPVTISSTTAGAEIRYTTDGSDPTAISPLYTAPLNISVDTTLKARAFKAGMTESAIAVAAYVISDVPVPVTCDKLLVGYWHNFDNGLVPVMELGDVDSDWDIINVAFADITGSGTVSFTPFNASEQDFIADVEYLKSLGKEVVLSLGGQNGAVSLVNATVTDEFIRSLIATINQYGFTGVDVDIETGIYLGPGDTDPANPTTPNIVNMIEALKEVCSYYGPDFLLSMAPEIAYVQGGITAYAGPWGAYLPIIHAMRDELTYLHVQHYNCGGNAAPDGRTYNQGTADFHVAMSEMLLNGFTIANGSGTRFEPLREDQVMFGIPAAVAAAPSGGYTPPSEVKKALNYLINGIPYGGQYQLQNPAGYPCFAGIMTWSVNWDAQNNYEFTNEYGAFFTVTK